MRDVMANLRPPVLDDYGLLASLRWYGDQVAHRTDLAIAVAGVEPVPRLSAHVENNLFRITQEALTNVVKHAEASEVTVALDAVNECLRLVIVDDGVGFDLRRLSDQKDDRGWGLLTMWERADAAGGRFLIESSSGQGTRIVVELPL